MLFYTMYILLKIDKYIYIYIYIRYHINWYITQIYTLKNLHVYLLSYKQYIKRLVSNIIKILVINISNVKYWLIQIYIVLHHLHAQKDIGFDTKTNVRELTSSRPIQNGTTHYDAETKIAWMILKYTGWVSYHS